MFNIVLYQPEIPPNTGNIIRLCANTGCYLHLIEPLGFELDDKRLRRAGLDYHEWADVQSYPSLQAYTSILTGSGSIYAISTRGSQYYNDIRFTPGDSLVFGPETRGLPQNYLDSLPAGNVLRLPMLKNSRSLNLSNTAAIVVYEALRQTGFKGLS
ncbi:MAG: tRNA (uridine(34)/cytosine(34)/5-carboxymethylaminomethyluridine(34)-2'-O)-methyltransferase TrmL [Gammaproteobacteria bacterium]|nr:tRNA (uridine(34)/cytosine(34)/5-carboxymethylaminomethyluridine(34)-2'-O)-methyltransferase TrmL [Gammaproteobacteria bacterium]MCW8922024.1 tRNA (uridine(34)/cytosine(34)/5-carboxymethylaminomethyluridine(34)-2'-O)-methyltransferase TrmL [Gammaproteobacteria bacterium]